MVSYDDARSFGKLLLHLALANNPLIHSLPTAAKGNFILQEELGGFAMWQSGGDFDDILLDAIFGGMGIEHDAC